MAKIKRSVLGLVGVLIAAFALIGCGGGGGGTSGDGGGGGSTATPSLQVLPSSFNFGTVTTGNTPAPLEVKVNNNGTGALNVSAITSATPFNLNINGGSSPCLSFTPTIAAGGSCTFGVSFQPTVDGVYSGNVQINSNDSAAPTFNLALSGTAEPVQSLNLRINQVEATCPEVTAYVSVTDQGGFPVTNLGQNNFTVQEGNTLFDILNFAFVSQITAPISIAVVMDYSGSLRDTPDALNDMQNGLVSFVQSLQASDRAEIIKFGTTFQVVQAFTSEKTALEAAILSQVDVGLDTLLFDTVNKAVDNTGLETNFRKAVIVITDGKDEGGNPPTSPFSTATLLDVINNASLKGVPIFTIGLGSNVNISNLTDMADQTGGHFFESQLSDNLNTIYQQISSILFENQYVIVYSGASPPSAFLTISATTATAPTSSDTRLITCP